MRMDRIGLFEAKTKFSEICEQVASRGKSVIVTRRGRPLVRIEPIGSAAASARSVWDLRVEYEKKHGRIKEEIALPRRQRQTWRNPLD
jgi:prevent-host-death family protein